jgi:hypothetical protein
MAGLLVAIVALSSVSADVLLQSDSRERFGEKDFAYFFFEAEDFDTNDPRGDGEAWIFSSEEDALIFTVEPDLEPDPGAFASGGESITNTIQTLVTNDVGGGHDVQYLLQFDTPGDYYLYIRQHSPLSSEIDRNKSDSFYSPIEFGEDPIQNKVNGDDYGYLESIEFEGDVEQRGPWIWFAAREFVDNAEQNPLSEQEEDTFIIFDVTPGMVGQEQILELDHREDGTMIDALLFIATDSGLPPTDGNGPDGDGFFGIGDAVDEEFGLMNLGMGVVGDYDGDQLLTANDLDLQAIAIEGKQNPQEYDLNGDTVVDYDDRLVWVNDLKNTWIGDSNMDGEFNSSDMVQVFARGKYEKDEGALWEEGDWNADLRFTSSDMVAAFAEGGYEKGTKGANAVSAVPEPSTLVLLASVAVVGIFTGLRRHRG